MGSNSKQLVPAVAIHAGEILNDELKARGIRQKEFASELGMSRTQLNEVIKGKRNVNAELAVLLEAALGLSAQYWMNLQTNYDINKVRVEERNAKQVQSIAVFEEIKEFIAVKFLSKQQVISGNPMDDLTIIEGIYGTLDRAELIAVHSNHSYSRFRKSGKLQVDTVNLIGWAKYSEFVCNGVQAPPFSKDNWDVLRNELRTIFQDNRNVQDRSCKALSEHGIKLVYQEKPEKAPIDGMAFWSGENPAIAMTLRHKRLDNFAFTLFHELGHVYLHVEEGEDKAIIDLVHDDAEYKKSTEELEADQFARDNLIPKNEWQSFSEDVPYGDFKVAQFAKKVGVHPSIVLGRICYETKVYNMRTGIDKTLN